MYENFTLDQMSEEVQVKSQTIKLKDLYTIGITSFWNKLSSFFKKKTSFWIKLTLQFYRKFLNILYKIFKL